MVNEKDLMALNSREEAAELLAGLTKKEIVQLANSLEVYIRKGDSVERITEKIIDSTVGVKLKHHAIMNMNLK
jgi:hypothetical protein